ncbi:MAG: hypothetical protein ACKOT0_13555 [bacterium]
MSQQDADTVQAHQSGHGQPQGHAEKTHMIQAVIFGLVFVALVTAVFGFLMGSYVVVWPIAATFAIWTVVSLLIFRGVPADTDH